MHKDFKKPEFSREELHAALHANEDEALCLIEDADKWAEFKAKLEAFVKKARKIPVLGGMIDDIICMIELADSYIKKEYSDIPVGTMVSIVAALIYLISPIDLIPDFIPIIGYIDDAAVVLFVLGFGVDKDLDKYRRWKENNRKNALDSFEQILAEELAEVIGDGYLAAVIVSEESIIKLLVAILGRCGGSRPDRHGKDRSIRHPRVATDRSIDQTPSGTDPVPNTRIVPADRQ